MEPPGDKYDRMTAEEVRRAAAQLKERSGHTLEVIMKSSPDPKHHTMATSNMGSWLRGRFERESLLGIARHYVRKDDGQLDSNRDHIQLVQSPLGPQQPKRSRKSAARRSNNGESVTIAQEGIVLVHFDGDDLFVPRLDAAMQGGAASVTCGRQVAIPLHTDESTRSLIFSCICSGLNRDFRSELDFYEWISECLTQTAPSASQSGIPIKSMTAIEVFGEIARRKHGGGNSLALPFATPECRFFALWFRKWDRELLRQVEAFVRGQLGLGLPLAPKDVPDPGVQTLNDDPVWAALEDEPEKIHDTQRRVAGVIFNKILRHFNGKASFDFRIVVPPRLSLESQTIARLCTSGIFTELNEQELANRVVKALVPQNWERSGHRAAQDWRSFIDDVRRNPSRLFLVIQDECHWGINKAGYVDCLMSSMRKYPNVIVLHVSATPENLLVEGSNYRNDHVIKWSSCFTDEELATHPYQGLEKLFPNNFLAPAEDFLRIIRMIQEDEVFRREDPKILEAIALTLDYAFALYFLQSNDRNAYQLCSKYTRDLLRDTIALSLNKPGKMTVIRFPNQQGADLFCEFIRKMRNFLGLQYQFDIVLDTGTTPLNMEPHFFDLLRKIHNRGKPPHEWLRALPTQYSLLAGIPCIVAIVEKGRMGDTFPKSSFSHFDLRARYTRTMPAHTGLIQDVGRAFGYGNRPRVLMSKFGFKVIEAVATGNPNDMKLILDRYVKSRSSTGPDGDDDDEDTMDYDDEDPRALFDLQSFEKKRSHMHVQLTEEDKDAINDRGYVLYAKPQIGKTGTFLALLNLCRNHMRRTNGK